MVGRPLQVMTWFCVGLLGPALLCGIGLLTYGWLSKDHDRSSAPSPDYVPPTERQSPSEVNSGQKNKLPQDLASLPPTTEDYTRSVALRALLSSSDQERVVFLLEQSKEIHPEESKVATQIEIFRRFAVFDPVEAMKQTFDIASNRRAPIINAIFLEWAVKDVDAAITHAKTLGSAYRRVALGAILRVRNDFSKDRIQELAHELGHESIGAEILDEIQVARALTDPRSAWNTILEDAQSDDLQYRSLATILELWIAREGIDVVSEAVDSIAEMGYVRGVLNPILTPMARDDPRHAFELINEFDENARREGAFVVVGEWAKTDPVAAINAVSEFDVHPTYAKNSLMQTIGSVWVDHAPHEAFQHLSKYLPTYSLQWTLRDALRQIVQESPQTAVDLLNQTPGGVEELGGALVEEWASTDASAALNWISSQEESIQPTLVLEVLPALVAKDPDLAMSTALNQTIAEGQMGLEYEVIRILARTDIDRATEMLLQVRDDEETMKRAYSELGRALANKNESSTAIDLGSELPESFRDDYFREIINEIYNTDKVELYEILDLLPERKHQQDAARYLLWESGFGGYSHRFFTDEQLEKIKEYQ